MYPLNKVSDSQRTEGWRRALDASARGDDSTSGVAAYVGDLAGPVAAIFGGKMALIAHGWTDVLEATAGEVIAELVDPMRDARTPSLEGISVESVAGIEETSKHCEVPTCQTLGVPHRWLYRVRSQRETYGDGENARPQFLTPIFCLLTSLRSTFECA